MVQPIGVECNFDEQGQVQVRRIAQDGRWQVVEPGRQWVEKDGRHVLVLVGGSRPAELIFLRDTLTWVIKGSGSPGVYVV